MENTIKFNIITKFLIILFGILTIFSPIVMVVVSGEATNPIQTFIFYFRFGIVYFPQTFSQEVYGIGASYNVSLYTTFVIIFTIAYFLNFGYFKKEEISKLRSKLDLVSIILMLLGLFGLTFSAIGTTGINKPPSTNITFLSSMNTILPGFHFGIITILIVLAEYIVLEKSSLLTSEKTTEIRIEPSEIIHSPVVHCSSCGSEIIDISGGFCSKCGAPIEQITTKTPLEESKYCSECGKEIKKSAKFCEHCSAKQ